MEANTIPNIILGSMYITNDPNAAIASVNQTTKCLCISDNPIVPNSDDFIVGAVLLPPVEAKIAEIDGDAEKFFAIYSEYLLSDVPSDFISVLLGWLHKGGNLIVFVDCMIDDPWVMNFVNHLMIYYGLHLGIIGTDVQFIYDPNFNDSNNNILYSAGMITPGEYLANTRLPAFPDFILAKLNEDFRSYGDIGLDISALIAMMRRNPSALPSVTFRKVNA